MTRSRKTELRKRSWGGVWNDPPIDFRTQIEHMFSECGCEKWIYQLEKVSRLHVQFQLYFKNPRGISFQEIFPKEIHWKWYKRWNTTYSIKVDSRVDGPWTNIEGLTWRKTIRDPLKDKELYPFQEKVLNLITYEPDDRKIHWFWSKDGNKGKSSLAKHLVMNHNCCLLGGTAKDNFCALRTFYEKRDIDIVVFDIPRCSFNKISYKTIECVKNGMVFCGKYESNYLTFNPPHVFVFCNFKPDLDKLSDDRWVIHKIVQ